MKSKLRKLLANAGLSGGLVVSKLRSFFHSQGANCVNSNPDLDKVIDEAISTFDDKKLVELIKKAQRIIYEDVPVIPISSYVAVYVAKKDVDYTPTKGYAFDLVFIKDVTFK
jgi:ABC-type transport system substrate-binding protein